LYLSVFEQPATNIEPGKELGFRAIGDLRSSVCGQSRSFGLAEKGKMK
jgi:hypothetical protein